MGLALILYSIFIFDKNTPTPSFYTLAPTSGAALIILFASKRTAVAKLLSNKMLAGIGLISYSAYLWHQPLFAFAKIRSINEPSQALMALLGCLTLGLAFITWQYIEKPFRKKSRYTRNQIFNRATAVSLIAIGLGVLGYLSNGFSSRTTATGDTFSKLDLEHRIRANRGLSETCEGEFTLSEDCRTSDQPEILVWGDSVAMHLVQGILASNKNAKIIQMTKSFCGPTMNLSPMTNKYQEPWSDECLEFNNAVSHWVRGNSSLRYAVLSSSFSQYLASDSKLKNTNGVMEPDESILYEYFSATLDFLNSQGIRPIVFSPLPGNRENTGACLVKASIFEKGLDSCDFSIQTHKEVNKKLVQFLNRIDQRHRVIWIDKFLCEDSSCRASIDNTFIYRDGGHLSHEGSALVGVKMDFNKIISSREHTASN